MLVSGSTIYAQNTSIQLKNATTQEFIPFAEIVLNKLDGTFFQGYTTNQNGEASFNLDAQVNYRITYLGFETLEGNISPGEHLVLDFVEQYDLLNDVVVTGQYAPQKADNSIYKIEVVDQRQMQQRGVNNLGEALANETNLRVSTNPATGTTIEMQGMSGENIKYLIDGVPIVGRVDGVIDLSQINMDNVDHIEIVQGPMSVVYGTSAIAGVINIITKKNTSNRNIAKVNGYVDNKNNYNFGFYGSIIRGKHTFSASGNRNMFQGIDIEMDDNGNIDSTDDRIMEFKPKLIYNGDLEYVYAKNDFKLRLATSLMSSELRDYTNQNPFTQKAFDFYYHTLRSINKITLSDKITESLSYDIIGAFTYFNRDTERIISDLSELTHISEGITSTRFDNYMTRGNFTYLPKQSKLSYQFGWDINHEIGSGERIEEEEVSITDYAAFASAQWQVLSNLSIQPGLRYIYNTSFDAPVIPSINVQYKPIENLNIRASYAKGFRAPSLKELYLDFQDINHNITGNSDLNAETTNSYNTSITYRINREKHAFKIEPSLFFNDGQDVISLIVTDATNNAAQYENIGGRRTLGLNFTFSYIHTMGLTLSAGYSVTGESFEHSSDRGWEKNDSYDNITFNAKYHVKKWDITALANYKFYGETPFLVGDGNDNYYSVYTESYSDLEVILTKNFFKDRLNVVVGGKNLFDNYVSRSYGYQNGNYENFSPINYGRTFFAKATIRVTN